MSCGSPQCYPYWTAVCGRQNHRVAKILPLIRGTKVYSHPRPQADTQCLVLNADASGLAVSRIDFNISSPSSSSPSAVCLCGAGDGCAAASCGDAAWKPIGASPGAVLG